MAPDPLTQMVDAVRAGRRFVLSSHARPDGDSIGSQLALAHALDTLGKTVRIVNHDPPPAYLATLPGADRIEVTDALPEPSGRFDAAVILECGTLDRTEVAGLGRQPVLNIDHHVGNTGYGAVNWFDPSAAACAELVHDLIARLEVGLTPPIGAALYTGILTDTGGFRHGNMTARTFDICRRVAACGVDVARVAAEVYQSSTLGKVRLTGRLLDTMRLEGDGRLALLVLDDALIRETGCPPDDLDGVINMPLAARAIQAVIMVKTLDGVTRLSFRSKGPVDVRAVAAAFGGGGHRNAAGCTLEAPAIETPIAVARTVAAIDAAATTGSDA
ncbi:MAG: hypothetical protein F4W89_04870 [Acidobacteria bacterium]|nr:hypothetical protein [Acidobacteriota bacterium]